MRTRLHGLGKMSRSTQGVVDGLVRLREFGQKVHG